MIRVTGFAAAAAAMLVSTSADAALARYACGAKDPPRILEIDMVARTFNASSDGNPIRPVCEVFADIIAGKGPQRDTVKRAATSCVVGAAGDLIITDFVLHDGADDITALIAFDRKALEFRIIARGEGNAIWQSTPCKAL